MADAEQNRLNLPLARLVSDLPVADGTKLHFEFEGVGKTLAELALNGANRTPFTVVVRGGWGRGKTTLLKRTQWLLGHPEEIAPSGLRRVETLWFNAWKYPSEETVLAGLLGQLLTRLEQGNKLEQLTALVASYKSSLLKHVLFVATPAPLRELVFPQELVNRFAPAIEKRAFHDTFRELFDELSRLLFSPAQAVRDTRGVAAEAYWTAARQEEQCLAIFLDDLDRCRHERVAEVLEAINLFLDMPGVCFYLGLDWQRLLDVLPASIQGAAQRNQYLEKIFQVALDLPSVSAGSAGDFVRDLVAEMQLQPVVKEQDLAVVAAALESKHPRHIKRFLNDLMMTLAVLRNAGKLGSAGDQVPEAAVLLWHLLPELFPAEEWRDLRELTENVRAFLRRTVEAVARGKAGEELPAESKRWLGRGFEAHHFQTLAALSDDQLHVLVHLASPSATVAPNRAGAGAGELWHLRGLAWVELPGGSFQMGSTSGDRDEAPAHDVTLSPFRISRYPVTNAEYAVYLRETAMRAPDSWEGGEIPPGKANHPVVGVSWQDAEAFCRWLTRKLTGAGEEGLAQLPTEAQWEFAARGSDGREYPWGAAPPDGERANFGDAVKGTTPVNAYPQGATPEGVHDLAGNVWEWCRDWYGPYQGQAQIDPEGPRHGSSRVARGGAFFNDARDLRGAYRLNFVPDRRIDDLGFRVVWSLSAGLVRA